MLFAKVQFSNTIYPVEYIAPPLLINLLSTEKKKKKRDKIRQVKIYLSEATLFESFELDNVRYVVDLIAAPL